MAFKLKFAQELKIDLPDGSSFKMQEPSAGQCSEYFLKVKTCGEDPDLLLKAAQEFIKSLGCPEEHYAKMSFFGIRDLVQFLLGEKKS